ncbi:MAG TPA: proton-conducting transporter membrane subunit [Anaerolineales bacterium]|nr:proton-conducting transporter membrane subunit [Anaerolineales bacterium]
MSAPLVWILFPGLLAGLLLSFHRRELLVSIVATLVALLLAGLALWLPTEEQIFVGSWTFSFSETYSIFGRQFILAATDRPTLMVLYLGTALWFGAANIARTGSLFVPLGFGMVVLLTAAIAVEPFLYAALLIEMAVLLSIPFLAGEGRRVGPGVLRYLTFQTLGMPFILFAGWMLSGIEVSPGELDLVLQATILLGLGFVLLLAIFPFHTWIPMLTQEAHPFAAAFVLVLLIGGVSFFGLGFINRFAWLREASNLYQILRTVGVVMVVTSGLWSAFQRRLDRMLGYAIIFETGMSLVSLGLRDGQSPSIHLSLFFASLLPRGLAFGLWALALSVVRFKTPDLSFRSVQGMGRIAPVACGSLVLAHLSVAGLPLLAGFPLRLTLLEGLAQAAPVLAFWTMLGNAGFLAGGLQILAMLVMGKQETGWQLTESYVQIIYLIVGVLALLAVGLFPQSFLPVFAHFP